MRAISATVSSVGAERSSPAPAREAAPPLTATPKIETARGLCRGAGSAARRALFHYRGAACAFSSPAGPASSARRSSAHHRAHRARGSRLRQADLRRQPGSLAPVAQAIRAISSSAPTSAIARRRWRRCSDFRPHWVMNLAAESHVDRSIDGPGGVHRDQCRRHLRDAAGEPGLLARARRGGQARVPLPSHFDRRSVRLAGRGRAAFTRTRPMRPTRPIRPPRRRPTIWCAPGITPTACRRC